GSGKTRVLVDRLFGRVLGEERANLDDFLIITYTRAAASELRERIARELAGLLADRPGDRHLQRQLLLVYQADIKTIDAFCTALLRENVHLLDFGGERGLTADFRVLDENEASLMRRRVLPRVLEEFYTDMTPGQIQLADAFGFGRDDSRLEELVLELYGKVQSHPYPERWLEEQKAGWAELPGDAGETAWGRELLDGLARKALHWARLLRGGVEQMDPSLLRSYGSCFSQVAGQLEALAEGARMGWDTAAARVVQFPRLTAARKCEYPELKTRMKGLWDRCKAEMGAACAVLDVTGAEAAEDLRRSAPAMEALLALCVDFSAAYQKEKLRRNAADFSDQEHYAVRLLLGEDGAPTELARVVSGRYREVMVDEYQDTNQVQNCVFDAISHQGRTLFTVGDMKQSIYRFRLADPSIFLKKYRAYPPAAEADEGEPRKILLSQNFRSRQPVLDAVNFVFEAIMSQEMGELDYGEEERLNFGAAYLPPREDCQTEFHLLTLPRDKEVRHVPGALAEARFVAERIARLLEEGYPVTDGDTGQLRPCRPEDIVVLMRSPNPRLRHYTRALAERGIPCGVQEDEDFFSTMEVAVAYALLQILDNPRQDVPLIAVLRSPLFGFTPDRLAVIRGCHPAGDFYEALSASADPACVDFLEQLEQLRSLAKDMSMHRLIWRLYNQLNMLGVFGAMAGGERRRENLIALYEHARAFEGAGYKGLFAFVSHLRFLLENGEQPAVAAGSVSSGVQIMSIHRSKGLEFPIVILTDLNKGFNGTDLQTPVLVHPQLGLGPLYIDLDRHIRYPTIARGAVAGRVSREMRAEEMRVLYVGMTRAKEKLILVSAMQSAAKKLERLTTLSALPVPPETVDGAGSMAEWLLLPLLRRCEAAPLRLLADLDEGDWALLEDAPWQVQIHDGAPYDEPPDLTEAEQAAAPSAGLPVDREALGYVYPYQAACTTSTKLTATQLKGREKDKEIAEDTVQPYVHREFAAPRFLSGQKPMGPEARGTAVHLVMQYVDLSGKTDAAATVADLVERRLLTAEQAQSVDLAAIRQFLASPLAQELRQADELEREYRFSLLVPAEDYYPELAEGDEVMLQGVVDLYAVKDGAVTVVDFKTDQVSEKNLPEKLAFYRPQLDAYSAALEKILGLPVNRKILYFFSAGLAVEP
ncbi:MAG: helicase-exonuclease AddAB subunit AddA, partial [Oscillospiraceae bacterium]|nr:helicase-exonuclease AddAB subunit AddA [Oscillospiraceae bacterium]